MNLQGLFKEAVNLLDFISEPGVVPDKSMTPSKLIVYLESLPIDVMNRYYESWPKRERKGKNFKIRWLSKVTLAEVSSVMQHISENYPLPASPYVYSYKKGSRTADCAQNFVGMKYIVALDIKDFYYAITGKMVEELYLKYLIRKFSPSSPINILKAKCIAKIYSIILMAKDVRPDDISFKDDRVLLQGTPHAGMIANAVLYSLDEQLFGVCTGRGYKYARYSDNFYIGSHDEEIPDEFINSVISAVENFSIAGICNFSIKKEKVKVMPYYTHQRVLGIVVNNHMNISSWTEDIINARISKYSSSLGEKFSYLLESESGIDMVARRRPVLKQIRKELRELKGLVSYLGSFNRSKYNKYSEYIRFLEQRTDIMMRRTHNRICSIYPYDLRPSEILKVSSSVPIDSSTSMVPGVSMGADSSNRFLMLNASNDEIIAGFAKSFRNGFMGILYRNDVIDTRILVVPLDLASVYLAFADTQMLVENMHLQTRDLFLPYRGIISDMAKSPVQKWVETVKNICREPSRVSPDIFKLESILCYNEDNPLGYVPFENYDYNVLNYLTPNLNICITRNTLDSPDIMYSNLWKLRKAYLRGEVAFTL